jgi:hypothetical protein
VDEARERLDVLDGSGREDAVAEVEDVPGAPARSLQDVVGGAQQAMARPEEQRRIEVALHRPVRADLLPGDVERQPPVDADDVESAPTHESKIWIAWAPASTWATAKALTTRARRSQRRCQASGSPYMRALVRAKSRDGPPSIAYDASVNGAPAKPINGTRPARACRVIVMASST